MASLSNLSNKREYMIFPLGVEKICLRSILHCIVTKMVLTKVYKKREKVSNLRYSPSSPYFYNFTVGASLCTILIS